PKAMVPRPSGSARASDPNTETTGSASKADGASFACWMPAISSGGRSTVAWPSALGFTAATRSLVFFPGGVVARATPDDEGVARAADPVPFPGAGAARATPDDAGDAFAADPVPWPGAGTAFAADPVPWPGAGAARSPDCATRSTDLVARSTSGISNVCVG